MKRRRVYLKRITLENRILLLLSQYDRYREEYTVPEILSQGGMAKELVSRQNHVSRAITDLESKGYLSHRSSHVTGLDRKRRVYFLDHNGLDHTDRLIRELENKYLTVRTNEGSIEEWDLKKSLRTVSKILKRKVEMFELVSDMISKNEIDLTLIGGADLHRARLEKTIPRIKEFFGRSKELKLLEDNIHDQDNRIISVISIAGQGKTSLVSKFIEKKNEKNVIWTSCNTYMGPNNFLNEISLGLRSMGGESLFSYMTSEGRLDLYDAVRAAINDLSTTEVILVIEDLHKAPNDLMDLFKAFKEAIIEGDRKVRVIVTSRVRPPIYTRTEVSMRRGLFELELQGLNRPEIGEMLTSRNQPLDDIDLIKEVTCGNPLALQLYMLTGSVDWNDARFSLDRFIQEEMVSQLNEREWSIVKLASLFRSPVYPKAFLQLEGVNERMVKHLIDRMLLVEYPNGTCFLHELLKESVMNKVTSSETRILSAKAFDHFSTRGSDPDIVETIHFANLAGKEKKVRTYVLKYGEYLACKGYQQVWDIAQLIDDRDLKQIDRVTKYLIGFESSVLKDDLVDAKEMLEKARSICDIEITKGGDEDWNLALARILNRFGELARLEGVSESAIKRYKESLAILRNANDQMGEAKALNNLGVAYLERGDMRTALKFFKDSERILKASSDQRGLSHVHLNMGVIYRSLGKSYKALNYLEKARIEAIGSGSKTLELESLYDLADLHIRTGDEIEAITELKTCIIGYQDIENYRKLEESMRKILSILIRKEDRTTGVKMINRFLKGRNRRSGFFYRRASAEMNAEERSADLFLHSMRSILDDDRNKAKQDLRSYLDWCSVNMSGDRFLDNTFEIGSMIKPMGTEWMDILYDAALSSSKLYDAVQPQVVLLIRWARKKHVNNGKKKMMLKKAISLSKEGGFATGRKKAEKLLSSLNG